jgi:hypothetical protein
VVINGYEHGPLHFPECDLRFVALVMVGYCFWLDALLYLPTKCRDVLLGVPRSGGARVDQDQELCRRGARQRVRTLGGAVQ